jgi:hypothetical protein
MLLILINFKFTKNAVIKTPFAIALSLSVILNGKSQLPQASAREKVWAFCHPIAAVKIKQISRQCLVIYNSTVSQLPQPDFSNGGRIDALRHLFFMAAYAQKIKPRKLIKLGRLHERANYRQFLKSDKEQGEIPDSLASVMDLYNNGLGLKLGRANRTASLNELAKLACSEISKGTALIMKRKRNGTYLDCNNLPIQLKDFSGRWLVPKCLVPSNTLYSD